jgi:E3 ubiquitin-protein ligase SHPRH
MPRTKQTLRRSRGSLLGPVRGKKIRQVVSPSFSDTATPNNEHTSPTSSESGSSEASPLKGVLSDELIEFVSKQHEVPEPPRKRQKIETPSSASKEPELEHIVVKETKWGIPCAGSKLSELDRPIERSGIWPYIHWTQHWGSVYITITDDMRQQVFHAKLPPEEAMQDVHLALLVDHESRKWAKSQGRLWTEFGVSLYHRDGFDYVELIFTLKWNTTSSPYNVHQATAKTPALLKTMARYFPDPNAKAAEKWSPQDFYQSVHSPDKNDQVSDSIKVEELESELYPFQKRAVQWLLRKEGVEWSGDGGIKDASLLDAGVMTNSFVRTSDGFGRTCYVNHLFGIVTLDLGPFAALEQQLRGGILAEEMGLGKTVEMISLISLHKRSNEGSPKVFDQFTNRYVQPTGASLIITPPSILQQWISEIKRHAPHIKVFHYEGIKAHSKVNASDLLNSLATSDVVISTYSVLAAEIHFTQLNPTKRLRNESKYPRPNSPIMGLSWWRILMDEAQMIESGVSKAAVVARMIPRVNAWCVTGTPVRRGIEDLLGLLVFLRYEPYASIKHIWPSLISSHKHEFRKLFGSLALRHSKQSVRDELKLPIQRRYVITMPFTPIEEQHYQELFNQMCEESGLDAQGAPLVDTWDPDEIADVMRRWLVR